MGCGSGPFSRPSVFRVQIVFTRDDGQTPLSRLEANYQRFIDNLPQALAGRGSRSMWRRPLLQEILLPDLSDRLVPIRRQVTVRNFLSRRAAEALMLEIRMLAASCGLQVARVDVSSCATGDRTEAPLSSVS